jgi:hypothetical protein
MSWVGRDPHLGILGTAESTGIPVLRADSLELLDQQATAFVEREPADSLYLIDDDKRIYKIVMNWQYHAAKDRRSQRNTKATFFVLFLVTGLAIGPVSVGVLVAVSVTVLYVAAIRKGIMNEIEAGIGSEVLLVLALSVISLFAGRLH